MTLQRVTLTGACHEERLGTVVTTEMELAGVSLRWAAASDVGCVRQLNEDSFVASAPVFLVADGMGGHDAGEVASALTVSRFASLADELPPAIDSVAECGSCTASCKKPQLTANSPTWAPLQSGL